MAQIRYELELDPLAVGLTRPPLFMGIALKLFVALVLFCMITYIYTQTLWMVPIFGLLYSIALYASLDEPRFYEYWLQYGRQTPPVRNYGLWGKTNSYDAR